MESSFITFMHNYQPLHYVLGRGGDGWERVEVDLLGTAKLGTFDSARLNGCATGKFEVQQS